MFKTLMAMLLVLLMASVAFAEVKESDGGPDSPARVEDPGPDAFGYMRIDAPGDWTFTEISGTGTFIVDGDDNYLPYALAQPFNFYGVDYPMAWPSTNGGVPFVDEYMNLGNECPLPDQNGIFVFNDDLTCYSGVYGEYFEVCPIQAGGDNEPCTIIMWNEAEHYGGSPAGAFDMELVLFHTTKNIGMLFDDRFVQDAGGTVGIDQGIFDFNYCLTVACDNDALPAAGGHYLILHPDVTPVEETSFGTLKAMYR